MTAYYLSETTGWGPMFAGIPTVELPNPNLTVSIHGVGSLSTNYNGATLQVGERYAIKAEAGSGFIFANWTGGTNLPLSVLTNGPTVQFVMEPNLRLQANFLETNKPTLTIIFPLGRQRLTNALLNVKGMAGDIWGVTNVWYQLNGGTWYSATTTNGWTNWTTMVPLVAGTNTIRAYAMNLGGNTSTTNSRSVVSSNTFQLQLVFSLARPLGGNGLNFSLEVSPDRQPGGHDIPPKDRGPDLSR